MLGQAGRDSAGLAGAPSSLAYVAGLKGLDLFLSTSSLVKGQNKDGRRAPLFIYTVVKSVPDMDSDQVRFKDGLNTATMALRERPWALLLRLCNTAKRALRVHEGRPR